MTDTADVYDNSGVRIGTARAGGLVYDHGGVRIGTVTASGDVHDFGRVRIGHTGHPASARSHSAS